jgi:lipoyl-dependent peroxiredoxin
VGLSNSRVVWSSKKGEFMERTASAVWNGSLKEGKGTISTQSGTLSDAPYSFITRFENGKGTNPEELIAAAHAGCFTMALSAQLGTMNFAPQTLRTNAKLTLEKLEAGWTISKVHLDVSARIPGISADAFQSAAASAKANCPVSRLLKAEITMDAHLEQAA